MIKNQKILSINQHSKMLNTNKILKLNMINKLYHKKINSNPKILNYPNILKIYNPILKIMIKKSLRHINKKINFKIYIFKLNSNIKLHKEKLKIFKNIINNYKFNYKILKLIHKNKLIKKQPSFNKNIKNKFMI